MSMPGGGTFPIQPGQVTDDTEMAMHLLQSLLLYDPQITVSDQVYQILFEIAKQYIAWLFSDPVDAGMTCSTAILTLNE